MYIKQVTLQGFKTYKDQTIVEPFSPHHNVVVGRNGSGKSNFFFAIRFVLSDMFSSMRPEERQQLLHEGTGLAVMNCFVEIVFDNSDQRMPVDRDEVILRRSIGLKKDDYYLDNKKVTKTDVINLLESSGFSRSNPYYIVQQGKIHDLALAKDSERLNLLKEVAGTSVYDERRAQSLTILNDARSKHERVNEVLGYIEERLKELESEKAELSQYQELDKNRRSIEYTIHTKELEDARKHLEELEIARQHESEQAMSTHRDEDERNAAIRAAEEEVVKAQRVLDQMQAERKAIEEERRELLEQRATLELAVRDLEVASKDAKSDQSRISTELKHVKDGIAKSQKSLEQVKPQFEAAVKKESVTQRRLEDCERRRSDLMGKQFRGRQFDSAEKRNEFLKKEIDSISKVIKDKQRQLGQAKKDLSKLQEKAANFSEEITERTNQMEARRQMVEGQGQDHTRLKAEADRLSDERRAIWAEEKQIEDQRKEISEALKKEERELYGGNKVIAEGLDSVRRILTENPNIKGVYGPLIELIATEPAFDVCVDVAAGNAIFNVVVDTDVTASTILHIMNTKRMPGRVTFLPMNKINPHPKPVQLDEDDNSQAFPLVTRLKYNEAYRGVVHEIFGKTLVCRTLPIATDRAQRYNMDCVTLEGDKASRKRTLQGGFVDKDQAKLSRQRKIADHRAKLNGMVNTLGKLHEQLESIDQTVTRHLSDIAMIESNRQQLRSAFEKLKSDVESVRAQMALAQESIATKTKLVEDLEVSIRTSEEQIKGFEAEMKTGLVSSLSTEENKVLSELKTEMDNLKAHLVDALKERTELETRKDALESELKDNLLKRQTQLLAEADEHEFADLENQLSAKRADLKHAEAAMTTSQARLDEIESKTDQTKKHLKKVSSELDKMRQEESARSSEVQKANETMAVLLNKRALLIQRKEECMRKIRELGSLPQEAFAMHQNVSTKQLYKKLAEVTKELKKFSHVNKKALDQYVSFSEQREELRARKREQDEADAKIQELITVLDNQKDEAIERTFKQVAKNFAEVFHELVPHGKATLVMQRRQDNQEPAESQEPDAANKGRIEQYTGVGIRVTFTGKSDQTHMLQQLSGGQKSLVALALIFAIQRCDPAPFYLFDEIDQALDAAHRSAVAEMIRKSSRNAQYITTTFRPELLANADKYYGVTFSNKVSHIELCSKQRALDFIEQEGKEK